MPKCEQCGKEVLFPFECSYCGKTFCAEHRLPENHQCPNLPKEPFWYQKQKAMGIEQKQKQPIKEGGFYFIKEENPNTQSNRTKSKKPVKKIAILLVAVVIVAVILWNAPSLISFFQNYFSRLSYTKVTVVEGALGVTIEFNGNEYFFAYKWGPFAPQDKFAVGTVGGLNQKNYDAVEGATYQAFGLEIVVSEVHSDYIVLLVKPTY